MLFLVEFVPITHPWDVVMGWFRIIHILTSLPSVAGHNSPFFAPFRTARRCWKRGLLHFASFLSVTFVGNSREYQSAQEVAHLNIKNNKQLESSRVSWQIHTAQILANL